MIESLPPKEIDWLCRFFSGRNELKWDSVVARSAPAGWLEQVLPWIVAFSNSSWKSPLVLPVFGPGSTAQWYAMASDEGCANALSQELTAFIGPSFSDFRGHFIEQDSTDVIEKALLGRFGRFVFRLAPFSPADSVAISNSLQMYLSVLRRRPAVPNRTQRPFGKIRAEFDRALLAGNERDVMRLREELLASGRVDAEQEKYLDIRILAGLGRNFQLAHDYPLVKSILGLSLPAQTISDLVGSLYSTYISSLENCGDDEEVLSVFRKEIADNFGPLFLERKGVSHPSVLKAFMLYELVQAEPNRDRIQALVAVYPEDDCRPMVQRWAGRLSALNSPSKIDLYESTRQALADEDYELALQFSFESLPAEWTYSTMLRCAVEMGDEEVVSRVLATVIEAPEAVRLNWTKRDLARFHQLNVESPGDSLESTVKTVRPDADWLSWVTYVESGLSDRPPIQILEDAIPRWGVEAYASDLVACRELSERIGNARGHAEETFRDALAPLVDFFVFRPEQPIRAFAPIYVMLIRIVAWSGVVTANELELASSVVQALVNVAPSKDDYGEAVDAYLEILKANSASGNVDWALNAAEMLALSATSDREARLRFFMGVVDMARSCSHRLSSVQYELLSLLAQDYECSGLMDSFPRIEASGECQAEYVKYAGLIGIYTLTEQAGQRARLFLRKLLPMARVELNTDHVATDRLKSLASSADIFVFAWKSSKHQAYFAAKEARKTRQILHPLGKGSASILDCVLGEIDMSCAEATSNF